MNTIKIELNRAEIERLMDAVNTASCALHEHLDFSTPEKTEETKASVWGREWDELGKLFSTLYDAREELKEREAWERFNKAYEEFQEKKLHDKWRKAGERYIADC